MQVGSDDQGASLVYPDDDEAVLLARCIVCRLLLDDAQISAWCQGVSASPKLRIFIRQGMYGLCTCTLGAVFMSRYVHLCAFRVLYVLHDVYGMHDL